MKLNVYTPGFAIALAWPKTYCKQAGAWYEFVMRALGFNKKGFYRAGHAAVVLVDGINGDCHYFDFGRYHAPYGHGRVRCSHTDYDLEITSQAIFNFRRDQIVNLDNILKELQGNLACHGEGELSAGVIEIDFNDAMEKAREMQETNPHPYGPFVIGGTNCSRFVNSVIQAGRPNFLARVKLKFLKPLTPTPMNNVRASRNRFTVNAIRKNNFVIPDAKPGKSFFRNTLREPEKNSLLPEGAKWLGGEGAGSWFTFEPFRSGTLVTRLSPDGVLECESIMERIDDEFYERLDEVSLTYPCDCSQVTMQLQDETLTLNTVNENFLRETV